MSAKKPRKGALPRKVREPGRQRAKRVVYSEEAAERVCSAIATSRKGIRVLCAAEGMPAEVTVLRWLNEHEAFRMRYARAKEMQMELLAEEILVISDDTSHDTIETDNGEVANSEWIQRSRLRVDTRKWLMSKLAPKKYGDKIGVEHSGEVRTHMTLEQFRQRVATAKANRA